MYDSNFKEILAEINRFKSVAIALSKENCDGDFILAVLINHLKIKFGKERAE